MLGALKNVMKNMPAKTNRIFKRKFKAKLDSNSEDFV